MAEEERRLNIEFTRSALAALDSIWDWNRERYGIRHANRYIELLRSATDRLSEGLIRGRSVPNRPDLRYLLIQGRSRKHGHVVVFRLGEDSIQVLNYFHTAQDWINRLE